MDRRRNKPGIPPDLWAQLATWQKQGRTQGQMRESLGAMGIQTSQPALSRALAKLRSAGLLRDDDRQPPPYDLTDDDELREIRRVVRRLLYSRNPFAALEAARILHRLRRLTSPQRTR